MIDLIFIIILAVFIGGMLKCEAERDRSRMLSPYQKEAIENACEALKRFGIVMQAGAGKAEILNDILKRQSRYIHGERTIILMTPTSPDTRFYDQHIARCNRTESEEK